MIFSITFVTIGAVATIFICKAINGSFEIRLNELAKKEKRLNENLAELRSSRKDLSHRLENLKTLLKAGITSEKKAKPETTPANLKEWLLNKSILTEAQYLSAEIYGIEKNIDIIGALLTLNMISIEIYEEAKALKLL